LDAYPVDGIELDWLRFPDVLPENRRSDFSILNDYMQRIRQLLDGHGKDLLLAVRVLPNEQDNLNNGVDVSQWVADGSCDVITIENFYIPTNFEMPISQWRASIQERNTSNRPYSLLCGSDWAVSCMKGYNIAMTPALVSGFASECLSNGADGVYLFNFFEENDTSSFELTADANGTAQLKNCFFQRIKAAKQPDALPRRYVHIGASNDRYPIRLAAGGCYTFTHLLKQPFGRCTLVVGCDADVPVAASIHAQTYPLQKEAVFPGFSYIPETQIGKDSEFIYAVSQAAPSVKSVRLPVSSLENELLHITIRNQSAQAVNILWLELSLEV